MDTTLHSLGPLFPSLRPHLRAVGAAAWRSLELLARQLPPACGVGCFELRLSGSEEQVDFLAWVLDEDGRQELASASATGSLPGGEPLRRLIEEWMEPGTLLSTLPVCWLEYDLPEGSRAAPFLAFGLQGPGGSGTRADSISASELRALIARIHHLLAGTAADEDQLRTIERCVRALPGGGRITNFGSVQPARRSDVVRLLAMMPAARAWDWLEAISWPGERRLWDTARAALGDDYPRVHLNLDVGRAVGPRLGIEFHLPASRETARPWAEFMRRLISLGGAAESRGEAVLAWLGSHTYRPMDAWPIRIERQAVVKIDVASGAPLTAKAYLSFKSFRSLL